MCTISGNALAKDRRLKEITSKKPRTQLALTSYYIGRRLLRARLDHKEDDDAELRSIAVESVRMFGDAESGFSDVPTALGRVRREKMKLEAGGWLAPHIERVNARVVFEATRSPRS
jgi:hypothetical protein